MQNVVSQKRWSLKRGGLSTEVVSQKRDYCTPTWSGESPVSVEFCMCSRNTYLSRNGDTSALRERDKEE